MTDPAWLLGSPRKEVNGHSDEKPHWNHVERGKFPTKGRAEVLLKGRRDEMVSLTTNIYPVPP